MNTFDQTYLGINNTTAAEVAEKLLFDMYDAIEGTVELYGSGKGSLCKRCTIKSVENMITFILGGWDIDDVNEVTRNEADFLISVLEELKS